MLHFILCLFCLYNFHNCIDNSILFPLLPSLALKIPLKSVLPKFLKLCTPQIFHTVYLNFSVMLRFLVNLFNFYTTLFTLILLNLFNSLPLFIFLPTLFQDTRFFTLFTKNSTQNFMNCTIPIFLKDFKFISIPYINAPIIVIFWHYLVPFICYCHVFYVLAHYLGTICIIYT